MLGNDNFYWGSIHKVIVAFGAVFSGLHIVRTDRNGNPVQTIKIPCEFGPKEKWLTRNLQNPMPGVDDQVEMVMPRISYEPNGFAYDPERKLTTTGRTVQVILGERKVLKAQYNPAPWNISFELNILTKTMTDSLMIVEQILPFFTPDYTLTVNDIPELGLLKDLPIVLTGVSHEDTWTGSLTDPRTITWTLQFVVKAYIYPPIKQTMTILNASVYWRINNDPSLTSLLPWNNATPFPIDSTAESISDGTITIVSQKTNATLLGTTRIKKTETLTNSGVSRIQATAIRTNTGTATIA